VVIELFQADRGDEANGFWRMVNVPKNETHNCTIYPHHMLWFFEFANKMAWTSQRSFTIDTFPYFYHVTAFHLPHSVFWTWHDTCVVWVNWSSWMSICFILCFAHQPGNLIFPWLLSLININTVFCWCDAFIVGFWMCFILWHVQFLRQYSP